MGALQGLVTVAIIDGEKMRVLSRLKSESVTIGDDLMITVLQIETGRVQIELSQRTKANRITFFDRVRATWLQPGQSLSIADGIAFTLVKITGEQVRLGFEAPATPELHRKELYDVISRADD